MNKFLTAIILTGVFSPFYVSAVEGCKIQPFDTTLSQGGSATVIVNLTLPNSNASYDLVLGNLPTNVTSGFLSARGTSNNRSIPLVINAGSNAQTGSFMIPLIYRTSTASEEESVCQFHLVITAGKGVTTNSQPKAPLTKEVREGTLPQVAPLSMPASPVSSIDSDSKIKNTMRLKSRGSEVLRLQSILQKLGYFSADFIPTGYFGVLTENAVKQFQVKEGIDPIGIVGPKTRASLNQK